MSYPSWLSRGRFFGNGLAGVLCTLVGSTAHASGALESVGAPTSANGLTNRALGRHADTAYFNPALLPQSGPLLEAGYFVLHTHGDIHLDPRPPGVDIEPSLYDAEILSSEGSASRLELRPLATADLPHARRDTRVRDTASYTLIGISRPLFDQAVTFGLFAILPLKGVLSQNGFFADEREQFFSNQLDFELLGDRNDLTSFALAVGSDLSSWLSLGVGANLALSTTTRFEVYVPDAADQRAILLNPDMTTSASYAPYLGFALRPSTSLTMTATLHAPVSADVSGENLLRFWNYTYPDDDDFVRQTYIFSQAYQPLRAGIGAAWAPRRNSSSEGGWEVGVQAVLRRWSQYRNRHGERPADPFDNTIEVSVGAATASRIGRLALDVGFVPSPVPPQTGRSNYVDNDRLATMTGIETPLTMFGSQTEIGAYLQAQLLLPRQVTKRSDARHPVLDEFPDASASFLTGEPFPEATGLQTNNPGYPGFESSGWMVGAGLAFRLPQ